MSKNLTLILLFFHLFNAKKVILTTDNFLLEKI
jgi:hypothetical protein